MKAGILKEIVVLGQKLGFAFLTTADSKGLPHLTVAVKVNLTLENELKVSAWFCPQTLKNLEVNVRIGVIVWDKDTDTGYQLLGKLEKITEVAILDGYFPKIEKRELLPQVERELLIRIEKILEFKQAPHSDLEEA